MKGDFSRVTFDVSKHFSRVLMQQGRVQLDADWNEQTAILLHYLRSVTADLIGPHAGPSENLGFEIIVDPTQILSPPLSTEEKKQLEDLLAQSKPPILIGKGDYYIDGILVENEKFVAYSGQPDYPLPIDTKLADGIYLLYVDVWERHITYLEAPSIREIALGGPDTATRAKVLWQIKIEVAASGLDRNKLENEWSEWIKKWQPEYRGLLKAQAKQGEKKSTEVCITSPEANYRGAENQLYRVEIHQSGENGLATFKWSRDNGSVVTGLKLIDKQLTVDSVRGLTIGKWLELTNDGQELRGELGTLVKIKSIDGDTLSLNIDNQPAPKVAVPKGEIWPTKARLWEAEPKIITEKNNEWEILADGVQIQFQQPAAAKNQYRSGDYWLIPVRVATGDVEWPGPVGNPEALPPQGVQHHYAPLALIKIASDKVAFVDDFRWKIKPLRQRV
ncbi:MAG: DUF6519 domain-containing protein [Methylococcaceae bacterium]|nr:DUF6519 domain-containing protein [Methylococcaceae bacterium]MDP2392036.1 DUF6519 domain-containing protein [Methylococcaceae bacterium]MDP3020940.1 DUF6519 domain-containing protein [Methylococcaceae bacterium]MDP3391153.1 DUF6519 domain-containing protein [Methylococcaceae bacterium]MDP3931696.1 DUF6519 domain-containing protein [Methylococcaceae bacterium]